MLERIANLPKSHSFFLFGPRGSGKTWLVNQLFSEQNSLKINLLSSVVYDRYLMRPDLLKSVVDELSSNKLWVIIDEIQKVPALLDVVHEIIEDRKFNQKPDVHFVLTGSSARKLRRGQANLLAGRAIEKYLFPLSPFEIGESFNLDNALNWGLLPESYLANDNIFRMEYLVTYVQTYLKEEIIAEQVIRKLEPFRRFLQIAAQSNGKIINYQNIADDVGTSNITVQSYFQILEDTLIGFYLPSYHRSVRKAQRQAPKFYLIDNGISRALARTLESRLLPHTKEFGNAFENFVVTEVYKLTKYFKPMWEISYLRTQHDLEIDLILDRPGSKTALIEIKSSAQVQDRDLKSLLQLRDEFQDPELFCLSNDPIERLENGIRILPWRKGLLELGLVEGSKQLSTA